MTFQKASLILAVGTAGLALAGCSNTASQLLTTGSIFSGEKKASAPAEKPVTPVDRALQVASVSARAQKCGYVFDPVALRSAFLTAETTPSVLAATPPTTQPVPPTQPAATSVANPVPATAAAPADRVALAARYDYTARSVAKAIAGQSNYCDDARTRTIKADLNRHLAGDYTPRKARNTGPSFSLISDRPLREELNPEWGYGSGASPTRTVKE